MSNSDNDGGAFIGLIIFGLAALFLGKACITIPATYSTGSRVGHVIKFSEKGVVCKTLEGDLVLEGATVVQTKEGTSGIWSFTVKSQDMAKKVQAAIESGERVKITYKQYFNTSSCWGATDYEVTDVITYEEKK